MKTNRVIGFSKFFVMGLFLIGGRVGASLVIFDDFDTTPVNEIPAGWTRLQPTDTSVGVSDALSVSEPHSLLLSTAIQTGGTDNSAAAFRTFGTNLTTGSVTVTFDAQTSATNHDSLYAKLRNATNQEVGGVRFNNTGQFAYQAQDGTWTATTLTYQSSIWYSIRIEFDLDDATFSAWANDDSIIADAPFRTGTTSGAASFIFQDRVFIGTGDSYIDNFEVIPEPSTFALLSLAALLGIAGWRRRGYTVPGAGTPSLK